MMADKFDSGLEPTPQNFPEVSPAQHGYGHQVQQPYPEPYPQQTYHWQQQPYDPSATTPKPEPPGVPSTFGSQTVASPFSAHTQPAAAAQREAPSLITRTVCGCSLLIFILSCIIALLSAAVIGLAATTGIESQRASNAAASLAALNASATGNPAATPSSSLAAIDGGCATRPAAVNKTRYTPFSLLAPVTFTRYCNRDAPNPPLLALFTADFDTCMDACAAYTKYMPTWFSTITTNTTNTTNTTTNNDNNNNEDGTSTTTSAPATDPTTCQAVSFIPAWTNKTVALAGQAPGNCYLKGGPQREALLVTPNIGVDCHAALVVAVAG